ncbi:MAG: HNH endonuclease [Actinomycetota bacterium]|nr:HNH endonuclease [Actinomycetota bacterium]
MLAGRCAATGAALAAGALSAAHARVITETMAALPPVSAEVTGRAEAFLIGQAAVLDPVLLGRAGRALTETLTSTPDADSRLVQQAGRRQLHLTPAADGMVRLAGWLDAEAGAVLAAAIDPLAAPRPAEDGSADPRPAARRRADALLDLITIAVAAGGLPASGKTPATVVVTIDHDTLAGRLAGAGRTPDGAVLPAAVVRRLACDAGIIPALLGTAGQPLDVGRTARTIPPGIRRALQLRDQGCAMPGCHTPPAWTDAHHIQHWANGGPTALHNLVLLCGQHHAAVHHQGWTVHIDPTDRLPAFHAPPQLDPAQKPRRHHRHGLRHFDGPDPPGG